MARPGREKFKVYEGVFDELTLNVLEQLKRKKYFDELKSPIKTGKEGDVYLAKKGDEYRAIKIFRITSANFKKISQYIVRDFRFKSIKGNTRKVIMAWTQKEFRNLLLAHKSNISVPFPFKQQANVIVMEYIDGPMLKDYPLENPQEFFDILLEQLYLLRHNANLVHGDLSEYNILVKDDFPYIIDIGQGMSVKNEADFNDYYDLYQRDIENIVNYFNKRYKLELDKENVFKKLA